jgi:hypothetical protein
MHAAASSILRVNAMEPFRIGLSRSLSWILAGGIRARYQVGVRTSSFSNSRAGVNRDPQFDFADTQAIVMGSARQFVLGYCDLF